MTTPTDYGAELLVRYAALRADILAALRDGNGIALERARADLYQVRRALRAAGMKTRSGDAVIRRWRARHAR